MWKSENGLVGFALAGPGTVRFLTTEVGDIIEYDGKSCEVVKIHKEPRRGPDQWFVEFLLKPKGETP